MGHKVPRGIDPEKVSVTAPWQDQVYDMEPVDFRHVVDHLRAFYDRANKKNEIYIMGGTENIRGIRVNCIGDTKICHRPLYESVCPCPLVYSTDTDLDIEIANKIGVPLVVCQLPFSLSWRDQKTGPPFFSPSTGIRHLQESMSSNVEIMHLQVQKQWPMVKGLTIPTECHVAKQRASDVKGKMGSCVIFRKDGKPLELIFLVALLAYARSKLDAAMNLGRGPEIWMDDPLAHVSKKEWQVFYNDFQARYTALDVPVVDPNSE